jgi:diaminopimelate epimerase
MLHGYKVKADFAWIVFIERIDFIQIPFALLNCFGSKAEKNGNGCRQQIAKARL